MSTQQLETVTLILDADSYEAIRQVAARRGMNVPDYTRRAVIALAQIDRGPEHDTDPDS